VKLQLGEKCSKPMLTPNFYFFPIAREVATDFFVVQLQVKLHLREKCSEIRTNLDFLFALVASGSNMIFFCPVASGVATEREIL
jgi:hypothetical protein